jgi:hypothetical protein
MNWHVAWKRSARDGLATLWLDSTIRAVITAAAYRIDSQLAKDSLAAGESRDDDRRILIELPLAVIFKIKPAERKVIVLRVWHI